jgi:hypothetical protein
VLNFPTGVELMTDLSAAAWVEEALRWWPSGRGFAVRDFVPDGFEAYARILHGTRRVESDESTKRWRDLANDRGKTMHPLVSFEALVGGRGPEEADDWDDLVPLEELNEREAATLSNLLAGFSATTDLGWFALWDGYGVFGPPSGYSNYPRVRTLWSRSDPPAAGREYLLFEGPLEAVSNFHFGGWWQPPNIWWPDDRSWCVASEVDGYDTFVGGSQACIQAVLDSSGLEALPVAPDAEFGPVDPLNPAPWDP